MGAIPSLQRDRLLGLPTQGMARRELNLLIVAAPSLYTIRNDFMCRQPVQLRHRLCCEWLRPVELELLGHEWRHNGELLGWLRRLK
jgi:hypothetical protein